MCVMKTEMEERIVKRVCCCVFAVEMKRFLFLLLGVVVVSGKVVV